jgi:transcription initiation factor TFIIB
MSTTVRCCPECDGRLTASDGETVCADCGLVVGADRIDRGPEWRRCDDDAADRKRTGAPRTRTRHDRGLSTQIGHGHGASTHASGRKRRQIARMRREHSRAQIASKAERNQVYAFAEIRRLTSDLSLPRRVQEAACSLFESAQSEDLLRGRSLEGFAAAAVYAACRTATVSRTRAEVTDAARADDGELSVAYDAMNADLGLPTGPIDPREYLPRFASRLDLSEAVERRAGHLAERGADAGLVNGRDPSGFAAACLYTAAGAEGVDCTQAEAADVADVAPVTVRSTYHDLLEIAEQASAR